jgi:hypothetical protein
VFKINSDLFTTPQKQALPSELPYYLPSSVQKINSGMRSSSLNEERDPFLAHGFAQNFCIVNAIA